MWGLSPKVVHCLYVSIIQPSISFASLVWWPGCQMASAKKRLSRVQRLACLGIKGATRTAPVGAMGSLTGPLPLDLVIEGEARSAAHRLWCVGFWSYLYSSRAHSSILIHLQRLDPVFSMGVNVMRPAFNREPKLELLC
jgi:hypothetical protein